MTVTSARALLAVSITAFAGLLVSAADAGHRRTHRGYDDGALITAYSRHGNGEISGPVRRGRHTWEVQLPRGTWVSCRRSCEETLRVETIDIFENDGRLVGYGTLQNQCGVFGCLEIHLPR